MMSDPNSDTADFSSEPSQEEMGWQLPASTEVQVDLGALSHPGRVRPNNEDSYLVARLERTLTPLLTNLPPSDLPARAEEVGYGMVVADGIGGAAGGEVASKLAIQVLVDMQVRTPDWVMRPEGLSDEEWRKRVAQRYERVGAAIKEEAEAKPSLFAMGTTLTLAYSLGSHLFLGHIGDSRAYLHRAGKLHRLTRDHTYAQALADLGVIRPEEVARHRMRHVLTQALSAGRAPFAIELHRAWLQDGDDLLLCTDGLTDLVEDAVIAGALQGAASAVDGCRALIDLALDRGGKDNVTVILARYCFRTGVE